MNSFHDCFHESSSEETAASFGRDIDDLDRPELYDDPQVSPSPPLQEKPPSPTNDSSVEFSASLQLRHNVSDSNDDAGSLSRNTSATISVPQQHNVVDDDEDDDGEVSISSSDDTSLAPTSTRRKFRTSQLIDPVDLPWVFEPRYIPTEYDVRNYKKKAAQTSGLSDSIQTLSASLADSLLLCFVVRYCAVGVALPITQEIKPTSPGKNKCKCTTDTPRTRKSTTCPRSSWPLSPVGEVAF